MADVVVKFITDTKPLDDINKKLVDTGKITKEDMAAFRELGKTIGTEVKAEMDKLGVSVQKGSTAGSEGFKTLRQQIKEAKDEVTRFNDQQSAGAIKAQKHLADLIDKQGDLNKRVQAFSPDRKFQVMQQAVMGAMGGVQALTGALQLFGVKNEEVAQIAQVFQGALNVSMGINSLLELKDTMESLKALLGITTVAQEGLALATAEEGVAATGAAAANTAFAVSLSATGIGAIAVALGTLLGAMLLYKKGVSDAADEKERLLKVSKDWIDLEDKQLQQVIKFYKDNPKIKAIEREIALLEAKGNKDKEIAEKSKNIITNEIALLNKQYDNHALNAQTRATITEKILDLENERDIIDAKLTKNITSNSKKQVAAIKDIKDVSMDLLNQMANDNFKNIPEYIQDIMIAYGRTYEEVLANMAALQEQFTKDTEQNLKDVNALAIAAQTYKPVDLKGEKLKSDKEAADFAIQTAQGLFDFEESIRQQSTANEIASLDQRKKAGLISEKEYQDGVKRIKTKAAEDDKKAALFNAVINIAAAIIRALGNPVQVALAAALGGIQLAKIAATPIPKFNKGTLSVGGVDTGHDSVMAMLRPGEAVIPTEINRAYHPSIAAIYKGMISPSEMNAFVRNKTTGRNNITASINPYDMRHAMKGMPFVVANADAIGEAVSVRLNTSNRVMQKRQ